MHQADLFSTRPPSRPVSNTPDPGDVRARLEAALAELSAADQVPWRPDRLNAWRITWPNMLTWLPEADRSDLSRRFEEQLRRLGVS